MKHFRALLLLLLWLPLAHAVQRARIREGGAQVYQYPNPSSPLLATLAAGTLIPASSEMVRDVTLNREYWYKVRLETGEYGYARADRLQTEGSLDLAKEKGIDLDAVNALPREELPWTFALRTMVIGGYRLTEPQSGLLGGEGELSVCLLLDERAYARRRLALGAAIQQVGAGSVALGSFIYRVFADSRAEPEIRIRSGVDLTAGGGVAGLSVGVRHPFSTTYGSHLAGYLEAGFLAPFSREVPFRVLASAGLGFHF